MLILQQRGDGLLTPGQGWPVAQRAVDPAPQQSSPHGAGGAVEDIDQRVFAAAGHVGLQLQVAAAGGVEDHGLLASLHPYPLNVGQRRPLGVAGVLDQAAGGAGGRLQLVTAKALQVAGAKLLGQGLQRARVVEIPGWLALEGKSLFQKLGLGQCLGTQQLGRHEAFQLVHRCLEPFHLHHREAAAGEVEGGDAEGLALVVKRGQQVVAAIVQQRLVGHRAGSDDAHHLALHRPLRLGRVAHLLTDRHRLAQLHQLGQVALHRMERHPGHGNRFARRLAPGGEGDVEQPRRLAGILKEEFVKIPHAIENQHVGMLRLDAQVLLHHGGVRFVLGFFDGGGRAHDNSWARSRKSRILYRSDVLTRQPYISCSAVLYAFTARRRNAAVATPTASFDNTDRGCAQLGLSFFNSYHPAFQSRKRNPHSLLRPISTSLILPSPSTMKIDGKARTP